MTQGLEDFTGGVGYKFDLSKKEKGWIPPKGETPMRLWEEIMEKHQDKMVDPKTLRKKWARKRRRLRRDLENWLPEVKNLTRSRQATAEVALCFETWYQLRFDQRLNHKDTVRSINEMLCLLLEVDPV